MAGASSHRLLGFISPTIINVIGDNLFAESDEIREWSCKVYSTLFQKQPEKKFIMPILRDSVLYVLINQVKEGETAASERLIGSLKEMIKKAPDLRLEDKMLNLCEVTNRSTPFSIP